MQTKPYRRTANYYETDQMGIIHHSNYIRWFEEARIDMLGQIGLGYAQMEEEGVLIPVLSVDCRYKQAVHFDDTVDIYVRLLEFDGITMRIGYEVREVTTGRLCTTGESRHCFFDKNLKLLRIKRQYPRIYEILKSVCEG